VHLRGLLATHGSKLPFHLCAPSSRPAIRNRCHAAPGQTATHRRHGRACPGHPRLASRPKNNRDDPRRRPPKTLPSLDQRVIQILPFRIHAVNEAHLPRAGPMFHCGLALNCGANVAVKFIPDEHFQPTPRRKAFDESCAMLECATRKIGRHPDIQRARGGDSATLSRGAATQAQPARQRRKSFAL
jgi:hypothetical protein